MDYAIVTQNIRRQLKDYITKWNLKSLVLGVSGGIDSALCAALAAPVCKELGIPLIGVSLPCSTNKQDEIDRADEVLCAFCTERQIVPIDCFVSTFKIGLDLNSSSLTTAEKIRVGNIKARVRMIYLYNEAHRTNGCVLSTDNRSELFLSFWTTHGDVGDLGMIQQLWKTECYELAQYLVDTESASLTSCINANPTDGLGITNSDLDQLGAKSYAEVDAVLQSYLSGSTEYIDHPVVKRHLATLWKVELPYNFTRDSILKGAQ